MTTLATTWSLSCQVSHALLLLCAAGSCIIQRCRDLPPHRSRTHPLILSASRCYFVGRAAPIPDSGRIIQPLWKPQISTQTTTTHAVTRFHFLPAHMMLQTTDLSLYQSSPILLLMHAACVQTTWQQSIVIGLVTCCYSPERHQTSCNW